MQTAMRGPKVSHSRRQESGHTFTQRKILLMMFVMLSAVDRMHGRRLEQELMQPASRPTTLGELLAARHKRASGDSEPHKDALLHEPFCPTVFIYDIPELWDYPVPLSELRHMNPAVLAGQPCGDGTFDTDQYTMAMFVLYRLSVSERCRVTKNPAEADLFIVPALPRPKSHKEVDEACIHSGNPEPRLTHLTRATAHRHLLLLSKGHINAFNCEWWRQPVGLLAEAMRVSYSVVVRGAWSSAANPGRNDSAGFGVYGPHDAEYWTPDKLASTRDFDTSDVPYPHSFSVPYPSDVHWDVDAGPGPWARLDHPRKFLASFVGGMHGEYGAQVRRRIVEVCQAAGEPTCHYSDINALPSEEPLRVKRNSVKIPKGHCHFTEYKRNAIFCLEPGGDSPYRKSMSDDIAMGCIPVVFSPYLELVDPWHWGHFRNQSHVYIDRQEFLEGRLDVFEILHGLVASGEARRMQEHIAAHGHAFQYSLRDFPGDAVERLLVGANREAERRGERRNSPEELSI